ncbi:hypothetical protein NDU88_007695 [Pleurodeles waltl]|uniref:Uncharacterized protein n=1 Tax=Pleurodeles waltl TaxID=8319 RepID=A0AAV7STF5_PLEWA|nr:hypothetical protein NDU88_007695 [Pleurodeles waltl]
MRIRPRLLHRFQLRRLDRKGLIGSPGAQQTQRGRRGRGAASLPRWPLLLFAPRPASTQGRGFKGEEGPRGRKPPPADRSYCSRRSLLSTQGRSFKGEEGPRGRKPPPAGCSYCSRRGLLSTQGRELKGRRGRGPQASSRSEWLCSAHSASRVRRGGPAAPPAGQPCSTRTPCAGSPGWRVNSEFFRRPLRS